MANFADPRVQRLCKGLEILCPLDEIVGPQSFSLTPRQCRLQEFVAAQNLALLERQIRTQTLDVRRLKNEIERFAPPSIHFPTPGAPGVQQKAVHQEPGEDLKEVSQPQALPQPDFIVPFWMSHLPDFVHATAEGLGGAEWNAKRQSCFMDAVVVPLCFHAPEFMRRAMCVDCRDVEYVATSASQKFREEHGISEMHRKVPLRSLVPLYQIATRIQEFLQHARQGATQGRRVSMAAFHDLIPEFEQTEFKETGRVPRREWRGGPEDATEVLDELFRIFDVPGNATRVESVWHSADVAPAAFRAPDLRRESADTNNVIVVSPSRPDEKLDLLEEISPSKLRWNEVAKTKTRVELVYAPYLLVQIARKGGDQKIWNNEIEAPARVQTTSGQVLELVVVICRHGNSPRGGHWTAFVREKRRPDVWILVDGLKARSTKTTEQMLRESAQVGTVYLYMSEQELRFVRDECDHRPS